MSESLFYDPAVLKVIRAILVSSGIRGEADLEDAIGEVVLDCIEYVRKTGNPPKTVAEAIAIARPIASARGVDAARKRSGRGKTNVELTGQADEHARDEPRSLDPVDQERMLATVRQRLKEDQIEVLSDVGAGVAQSELAAETGASHTAMRKRVQKSRDEARAALRARGYWVGGFAALLASALFLYFRSQEPEPVSAPRPRITPSAELAAKTRAISAIACEQRRWDDCEKGLNAAEELDEDGERAAGVRAMREAIAAGRRAGEAGDGGRRGE